MPGLAEKLVTEFEDLQRQRPFQQYGEGPKRERERLLGQKKALVKPHHIKGISLIPGASEDFFSNEQLSDIQNDGNFAAKIIRTRIGRNPTNEEITGLQNRISQSYPNLANEVKAITPLSWGDKYYNILKSFEENQNNFGKFADFIIENPEMIGEGEGSLTIKTLKDLKAEGYPINDNTRAIINGFRNSAIGSKNTIDQNVQTLRHQQRVTKPAAFMHVLRTLPKSVDDKLKLEKREREQEAEENVRLDVDLGQQIKNLAQNTQRIAPLNEVHEQAKQLLNRNRGLESDTLATARDKLAAAERMDVPGEIAPYLQAANRPPRELIEQFMTDYRPVIEGFRQEAAKDFLENDLPRINSQFASKGAFFSGAREAALNKARADKEARIEREAAKLFAQGHSEAIKHHHMHREGTLKSAEIAGNARKSQKESLQHAAEALRANAQVEHGANLQNVGALSNIARTQQEQAQHEIDVRMAEHREQQERPFVELSRKSAIAGGHPLPAFNFSPIGINPPPPNVYSVGANLLGHAAGLHKMGYSAEAPFKKGGHVSRKYAKGGSIARHAGEWQQLGQHMEGMPSAQIADESMREAQATRHHRIDPMGAYLMTLSSHQMANPGKSMVQSFGEGSQKAFDAFNAAKAHNVDSKSKYINLINAINKSRMDQQTLLADYHLKRSTHEENQRYHNMANAESIRSHNMMNEQKKAPIGNSSLPSFPSKVAESTYYKAEDRLNKKFEQDRDTIDTTVNNVSQMKNAFEEGIGETGPAAGYLPHYIAAGAAPEHVANRRLFEMENIKKVVEEMSKVKGVQSDQDRDYIARTQVSLYDTPETIKKYISNLERMTKREEEYVDFISQRKKEGIPMQVARDEWEQYIRTNPLFGKSEKKPEKSQFEEPEIQPEEIELKPGEVKMIFNGTSYGVSKERVNEGLANGMRLAS